MSSLFDEMRRDCPMRHENGNCTPAGGFCTAVNDCICLALHNAYECGRSNVIEHISKAAKKKITRPVVRVNVKTGDVVRFSSVKEARASIGGNSLSMNLLTNRPLKGYRFYYEEDWEDGDGK